MTSPHQLGRFDGPRSGIHMRFRRQLQRRAVGVAFLAFGVLFGLPLLVVAPALGYHYLIDTQNPYAHENLWVSGALAGGGLLFGGLFATIGVRVLRRHRRRTRGRGASSAEADTAPPRAIIEKSTTTTRRTDSQGRTVTVTEVVTRGPNGTTRTRTEQVAEAEALDTFPVYEPRVDDEDTTFG